MPEIQSKKTGQTFPVSDATWAKYAEAGVQQNFRVTKKDVSPPEVTDEKPAATAPKKLARTSGETAE